MAGKYDHIDFKSPASVAQTAARGLEIRQKAKKSHKGGLITGQAAKEGVGSDVQRAVNLKNRTKMSPATVRRMLAFFQRHEKNSKVDKGKTALTDKGYQVWCLWGGNPGYAWARKIVRQMDAADAKAKKSKASADQVFDSFLKTASLDASLLAECSYSDIISLAHRFDAIGATAAADSLDEISSIDNEFDTMDEQDPVASQRDYSEEAYQADGLNDTVRFSSAEEIAEKALSDLRELGLSAVSTASPLHIDIVVGEEVPQLISIDRETKSVWIHNGVAVTELSDGAHQILSGSEWTEQLL